MATLDLFTERPARVQAAVDALAQAQAQERGAVYTKPDVVNFILDLIGYSATLDLSQTRFLDPSFGRGEFISAAIHRLMASHISSGGHVEDAFDKLKNAVRGVELHGPSFLHTHGRLREILTTYGLSESMAQDLTTAWLIHDDFLLTPMEGAFTHIGTNPPYLRQESIPNILLREYRRRYSTIFDRADLYVPFIERGLMLLAPGGSLSYICSDRWTKNRYGGPLRKLVADHFHLASYVEMVGVSAFEGAVTAYPAIVHIKRQRGEKTVIARRPPVVADGLKSLALVMRAQSHDTRSADQHVRVAVNVVRGSEPWLLDSEDEVDLLRKLENTFPTLEESGCKVGIGVATGADHIFVRAEEDLVVEASRKLPLLQTDDIRTGTITWSGSYVLNPFEPSGSLVQLNQYPLLAAYLHTHERTLRKRHVAMKNPKRWYRTIDPIHLHLVTMPKLLIPDIKGTATVVFDDGRFYPHHNLYHITSSVWDLLALQTILRSSVAEFIVSMYSVKMRGGYLRFQAQYLRRIRLPYWEQIDTSTRENLRLAAEADRTICDDLVFKLFRLSPGEKEIILNSVTESERKPA